MSSCFILSKDVGRQDGFALLTVLFFSLIITISALAYFQLGDLEVGFFYTDKRYWKALYAAEAGRERLGWLLKRAPEIPASSGKEMNPFDKNLYPYPFYPDKLYDPNRLKLTDILARANPEDANQPFFPKGEKNTPYFRVVDIWGEGSKVYYRIMGSVDTDGDGVSGLSSDYGGGYDFKNRDAQDVNRYFEGYINLPGSLGQEISAGARNFYDGAAKAILSVSTDKFITDRGEELSGFRYHESDPNHSIFYRYVFSRPILRGNDGTDDSVGNLLLPRGLFDSQTGIVNASYFSGLTMREYEGEQIFNRNSDPTGAISAPGKAVIFVNGDVTINQVNFGYFTEGGTLMGNDWRHTDVVIVSTGNLTARDVDCGMAGRLILVAKNIYLEGSWGSVVNGLAIASNDIYLRSSASADSNQWVKTSFPRHTYWSAYFYGTILAGNTIHLDDGGWSVIYDKNVINGLMSHMNNILYDRGESGTITCWVNEKASGDQQRLKFNTGHYLQDEIDNHAGDSQDQGDSTPQEVLRIVSQPDIANGWEGVGESVRFKLDRCGKDDIAGSDDWSKYRDISFYMALDNYQRVTAFGGVIEKETWKEAGFSFGLKDADGNEVNFDLTGEKYQESTSWGKRPYFYDRLDYINNDIYDEDQANDNYFNRDLAHWKRIDIHFSEILDTTTETFDFSRVSEFYFKFTNMTMRFIQRVDGVVTKTKEIRYDGTNGGSYVYYEDGSGPFQISTNGDAKMLQYSNGSDLLDITWDKNHDGSDDTPIVEDDLRTTLRLDRIEVPGAQLLNYGLVSCFRYGVSRWRELSENEAMR